MKNVMVEKDAMAVLKLNAEMRDLILEKNAKEMTIATIARKLSAGICGWTLVKNVMAEKIVLAAS